MYQFLCCDVKPGSNLIDLLVYEMPMVGIKDSSFNSYMYSEIHQSANPLMLIIFLLESQTGQVVILRMRYVRESPFL